MFKFELTQIFLFLIYYYYFFKTSGSQNVAKLHELVKPEIYYIFSGKTYLYKEMFTYGKSNDTCGNEKFVTSSEVWGKKSQK